MVETQVFRQMTVRARTKALRSALAVIGDLEMHTHDPVNYGRSLQLVYDMFAVWGWEHTGGQKSIAHNLGDRAMATLAAVYDIWKEA